MESTPTPKKKKGSAAAKAENKITTLAAAQSQPHSQAHHHAQVQVHRHDHGQGVVGAVGGQSGYEVLAHKPPPGPMGGKPTATTARDPITESVIRGVSNKQKNDMAMAEQSVGGKGEKETPKTPKTKKLMIKLKVNKKKDDGLGGGKGQGQGLGGALGGSQVPDGRQTLGGSQAVGAVQVPGGSQTRGGSQVPEPGVSGSQGEDVGMTDAPPPLLQLQSSPRPSSASETYRQKPIRRVWTELPDQTPTPNPQQAPPNLQNLDALRVPQQTRSNLNLQERRLPGPGYLHIDLGGAMFDPNMPHGPGQVLLNMAGATFSPSFSNFPQNTPMNTAGAIQAPHLPNFPNSAYSHPDPHVDFLYDALTHAFQQPLTPQTASFLVQTQHYPDPRQKQKQRPKDILAPNNRRPRDTGRPSHPQQHQRSGAPSPQLLPRAPTPLLAADPLELLKTQSENIRDNDFRTPGEVRQWNSTNTAMKMLTSLRQELKNDALRVASPRIPERTSAIPPLKDLAIYYIPVVKLGKEDPPLFSSGNVADRQIMEEDTQGCTWCLWSCEYGISDERCWLPVNAASGFCMDCHTITASFYDEWKSDPNHFAGVRGNGRSTITRRLAELDKMSNVPLLKEVSVEEGWKDEALRLDAEMRKQMGREPRKEREVSRTDGKDITRFMGPCFCRGCECRQVDLRKVRSPFLFLPSLCFISQELRIVPILVGRSCTIIFFPLSQLKTASRQQRLTRF
jgi:hypothetical protein